MKSKLFISSLLIIQFLFISYQICLSQSTLIEKLGYSPEEKLLIIHADDLGSAHSENRASFLALKIGLVNSASIMMPCAWVKEVAEFAEENPEADLGLHLTVTSEWRTYKWGPAASRTEVSSLVDSLGYFYDNCAEFVNGAEIAEVERELRAQIDLANAMGIRPTHLDSHMGCLFYRSDIFELYVKLGREYKIPVLIAKETLQGLPDSYMSFLTERDALIDRIVSAGPSHLESGMAKFYAEALKDLKPGINELIIHAAFNDAEMQAVTVDHPLWGAQWRQNDFDFFTSEKCRKLLEENDIKLITWREIQEAIYGK